jgi:hypothetical protein
LSFIFGFFKFRSRFVEFPTLETVFILKIYYFSYFPLVLFHKFGVGNLDNFVNKSGFQGEETPVTKTLWHFKHSGHPEIQHPSNNPQNKSKTSPQSQPKKNSN